MQRRRTFLNNIGIGLATGGAAVGLSIEQLIAGEASRDRADAGLRTGEIQHMVIFDLKHPKESAETLKFLKDAKRILSAIPGVNHFQVFTQVSPKNDYDFGFSMVFPDKTAYERYNNHPDHIGFVEQRWKTEVARFLEIDFATKVI